MHLCMFQLYSQNQRGTVALVVQGVLGVQLVPWDLEALPVQSALVYLAFLRHPEHPEVRRKKKSQGVLCLFAELQDSSCL